MQHRPGQDPIPSALGSRLNARGRHSDQTCQSVHNAFRPILTTIQPGILEQPFVPAVRLFRADHPLFVLRSERFIGVFPIRPVRIRPHHGSPLVWRVGETRDCIHGCPPISFIATTEQHWAAYSGHPTNLVPVAKIGQEAASGANVTSTKSLCYGRVGVESISPSDVPAVSVTKRHRGLEAKGS